MKKMYLTMAAAIFAASVSAQKPSMQLSVKRPSDATTSQSDAERMMKHRIAPVELSGIGMSQNSTLSTMHRAAAGNNTIITEQPAGTLCKNWYQRADGYLAFVGYVFPSTKDGGAIDVVKGDDGSIYVKNMLSTFASNYWVKGEKAQGDTIVFNFPQTIYSQAGKAEGSTDYFSIWRMILKNVEQDGKTVNTYAPDETTQSIKFILRNDSLLLVDQDILIGLGTAENGVWTGYGDMTEEVSKFERPIYAPSNSTSVQTAVFGWAGTVKRDYGLGKIAFEGDDVYIGGFIDGTSNGWAKGHINGNKVTFSDLQYLGVDTVNNAHAFFTPADFENVYDSSLGYSYDSIYMVKDIVFDYDPSNRKLSSSDGFIINRGIHDVHGLSGFFSCPSMQPWIQKPGTPENAYFYYFMNYDEQYGLGTIQFYLSCMSTDDVYLNPNNIYYNLYFDDELFTFTSDEYPEFTEDITDVPYTYSGNAVKSYGDKHIVNFYTTGFNKVGIKTIYKDGSKRYESPVEWYYVDGTGISKPSISTSAPVSCVSYTDLSGRTLSIPAHGVNIKIETLSDGTVRTSKVIVR